MKLIKFSILWFLFGCCLGSACFGQPLHNMRPDRAGTNLVDQRFADHKLSSYELPAFAARSTFANYANVAFGQFTRWITFAANGGAVIAASSFIYAVLYVIGNRSEKQMIGQNAFRSVATVTNKQPVRNCSERQLITKAMRKYSFAVDSETPIASINHRSGPKPARFSFIAIIPKPNHRCRFAFVTSMATKTCGAGWIKRKVSFARGTNSGLTFRIVLHLESLVRGDMGPDASARRGPFILAQQ